MALVGRLRDELSRSEYLLQIDAVTCQYKYSLLNLIQLKQKS